MLDDKFSYLSGDPLFAKMLKTFTGNGPFEDDSFASQMRRNNEAMLQVADLPRMSTHGYLLEEVKPTIGKLRNFEQNARRHLERSRASLAETLVARERRYSNLQDQHKRLLIEEQRIRAFDSEYQRLFAEAFALSRQQEPIGIVPVFAIFAIGRQAESKGNNGRCKLTIRTREDGFDQRILSASSEPNILTQHWRPTEQPSQFTRRGNLPGRKSKPKNGRPKQRTYQPRAWFSELDLHYDFPGIVPDRVRDNLDRWDEKFQGDVFLLTEANQWQTDGARFNNPRYGDDPIVFGRWINQDGLPHYWLLDRFDLSGAEFQAMEHTAKIVHGQHD